MNKTVTLSVDGHSETVRTFGADVNDVLKSKGVTPAGEDKVSPARGQKISDGDKIDVKYARPMTISVDGRSEKHVVHNATVEGALDSLDVTPKSGAYLSAKPDSKVPRKGIKLVVSNPKALKVVADGDTKKITTAAPTVEDVLDAAGVKVDGDDEVKPGKTALVAKDTKLKVVRIEVKTKTEEVDVKFPIEATDDSSMTKGETDVVTPGKLGKKREKVTLTTADGKTRERKVLDSKVLSKPVKQVEKHGTKAPESATGNTAWDKIAKCEAGGNWQTNTGNGYYGGLQFSAATWHSVGGPALPHQSSRETQIKYAKILQSRSGWGQWGCAHARFD